MNKDCQCTCAHSPACRECELSFCLYWKDDEGGNSEEEKE